jgi:hypothetical protein
MCPHPSTALYFHFLTLLHAYIIAQARADLSAASSFLSEPIGICALDFNCELLSVTTPAVLMSCIARVMKHVDSTGAQVTDWGNVTAPRDCEASTNDLGLWHWVLRVAKTCALVSSDVCAGA